MEEEEGGVEGGSDGEEVEVRGLFAVGVAVAAGAVVAVVAVCFGGGNGEKSPSARSRSSLNSLRRSRK